MKYLNIFFSTVISIMSFSNVSAQFKSMDFEFSVSGISDDYRDTEYEYEDVQGGVLGQILLGYTFSINKKMSFTPKVGYSYSLFRYSLGRRLSSSMITVPDPNRTIVQKDQLIDFFKFGIAFSYWINHVGKGFFLESELQNMFSLSASSKNMVSINGATEKSTVDFIEEIRKSVPSLRIFVGYNLAVKRFNFFLKIGGEFRVSTYFKSTDNYTFFNRSFGLGIRYAFQNTSA